MINKKILSALMVALITGTVSSSAYAENTEDLLNDSQKIIQSFADYFGTFEEPIKKEPVKVAEKEVIIKKEEPVYYSEPVKPKNVVKEKPVVKEEPKSVGYVPMDDNIIKESEAYRKMIAEAIKNSASAQQNNSNVVNNHENDVSKNITYNGGQSSYNRYQGEEPAKVAVQKVYKVELPKVSNVVLDVPQSQVYLPTEQPIVQNSSAPKVNKENSLTTYTNINNLQQCLTNYNDKVYNRQSKSLSIDNNKINVKQENVVIPVYTQQQIDDDGKSYIRESYKERKARRARERAERRRLRREARNKNSGIGVPDSYSNATVASNPVVIAENNFKPGYNASVAFNNPDIYRPVIVEDPTLGKPEYKNPNCQYLEFIPGVSNDINLKYGYVTDIILPGGDKLQRITCGDRERFNFETYFDVSNNIWHLYVKPLQNGIATNVIIATDKHNFQANLSVRSNAAPSVKWNLPDVSPASNPRSLIVDVKSVKDLNFEYQKIAKKHYYWAPENIFDDRNWNTFITFEPGRLSRINPVIFSVSNDGMMILPYEKIGDTLVIHSICDGLILRVGNDMIEYRRK